MSGCISSSPSMGSVAFLSIELGISLAVLIPSFISCSVFSATLPPIRHRQLDIYDGVIGRARGHHSVMPYFSSKAGQRLRFVKRRPLLSGIRLFWPGGAPGWDDEC